VAGCDSQGLISNLREAAVDKIFPRPFEDPALLGSRSSAIRA